MKLIFTPGSQELTIDYFTEHKKDKRFSGSHSFEVIEGSVFPEIPDIYEFDSVQCINDREIIIPLMNNYSKVETLDVTYNEEVHTYTVNVVMI